VELVNAEIAGGGEPKPDERGGFNQWIGFISNLSS
jgi:hypothetical protein